MGATEPVVQEEPFRQGVQCWAADKLGVLPKRPLGHGSGADAPSGQYDPISQASHAMLPRVLWNLPGLHREHVAAPLSRAMVPGMHSWQRAALLLPGIGFAFPGAQAMHAAPLKLPLRGLYVPGGQGS